MCKPYNPGKKSFGQEINQTITNVFEILIFYVCGHTPTVASDRVTPPALFFFLKIA